MAKSKVEARKRRKSRIRSMVRGTADRPRLTVFRSLKHIYAQVIDDDAQQTLTSASTMAKADLESIAGLSKLEQAKKIGQLIASRCETQGISKVVFDRNGYKYHGRVRAVAAGARESGLQF